jgi:DNA-binding LacI/PurR family transcriptional regulator
MELPHADMARHAVEELHRLMLLPGSPSRHPRMKFDCPLVARRSVSAPGMAEAQARARAKA